MYFLIKQKQYIILLKKGHINLLILQMLYVNNLVLNNSTYFKKK